MAVETVLVLVAACVSPVSQAPTAATIAPAVSTETPTPTQTSPPPATALPVPTEQPTETAPAATPTARYRPPSGWTIFSNPDFVQGIAVHDGVLWAATEGGVAMWDLSTGEPELFTTRHGLAEIQGTDVVYCPMPEERIIVSHPSGLLSAYDLALKKWSRLPITFDDGSTLRGVNTLRCDPDNRRLIAGSRDGLGIFNQRDGQWKRIGAQEGLNVDTIRSIEVVGQSIWVAAGDKSAYMIAGSTIFPFNASSGYPSGAVNDLSVAPDASLWIGYPTGLVHYRDKKWNGYSSQTNPGMPFLSVDHVEVGPDRQIWIGSSTEGVCPFDPTTYFCSTIYTAVPGAPIMDLVVDESGIAYAATHGAGVLILGPGDVQQLVFDAKQLSSNDVRAISQSMDGRIWVATGSGVDVFDPLEPEDPWETIKPSRGQLVYGNVTGLLPAETGMWFLYEQEAQASFYDQEKWMQLDAQKGLAGPVLDAEIDHRGYVWFATVQGIKVWDGSVMRSYVPQGMVPGSVFHALLRVGDAMWAGSDHGLFRYYRYQWEMMLPGVAINTIARDRGDGLLLGTDAGLVRYDGGQSFVWMINLGEEVITNPHVSAITWSTNGHLWVGTDGDGLFRFDGRRWERFTTANGLPTNKVRALFTDSFGAVWIALTTGESGGALARYMP